MDLKTLRCQRAEVTFGTYQERINPHDIYAKTEVTAPYDNDVKGYDLYNVMLVTHEAGRLKSIRVDTGRIGRKQFDRVNSVLKDI